MEEKKEVPGMPQCASNSASTVEDTAGNKDCNSTSSTVDISAGNKDGNPATTKEDISAKSKEHEVSLFF